MSKPKRVEKPSCHRFLLYRKGAFFDALIAAIDINQQISEEWFVWAAQFGGEPAVQRGACVGIFANTQPNGWQPISGRFARISGDIFKPHGSHAKKDKKSMLKLRRKVDYVRVAQDFGFERFVVEDSKIHETNVFILKPEADEIVVVRIWDCVANHKIPVGFEELKKWQVEKLIDESNEKAKTEVRHGNPEN
jgi:hypothetical protein